MHPCRVAPPVPGRPGTRLAAVLAAVLAWGLLGSGAAPALAHRSSDQPAACTPRVPLVDPGADAAARCAAATLDHWRAAGRMGAGQQLNVSNADYLAPLEALDHPVAVVGFDLWELHLAGTYPFPFQDRAVADLARLAGEGALLTASWHVPNPHTGGPYDDRRWHDLAAVLDPTAEAAAFWSDFDDALDLLRRLQDAGVAVVFRPMHEANGGWFWWGRPRPRTYRALWARMQARAAERGIHNIVWAWSFAARTHHGIARPDALLPTRVDVAGIDAYDQVSAGAAATVPLGGYARIARQVRRMAFTEVGPADSADGAWNPAVITRTARSLANPPRWAMLWFDDATGRKQISSLRGGPAWLDRCPAGLCRVS